jgi:hypothetical protein
VREQHQFRIDFHPHVDLGEVAKYFMIIKAKRRTATQGDDKRTLLVQTDDAGAVWMKEIMPIWERGGLCHWWQLP